MSSEIRPFKVDIPVSEVERLQRKLQDTRLPGREIVPNAGSQYGLFKPNPGQSSPPDYDPNISGPPYEWARTLHEAWTNDFDWYSVQAEMNEYPHYIATIEDLNIHFLHARADSPRAIPLLMIHGWPGSFWEFSQVWHPLSHPANPNDPAFHVVAPSMPGFCWSSWPPRKGWTLRDNARVFDTLMKKLGYEEYMVQCGDWGHFVGRELGARYTDSCKLLHTNFAPSPLPEGVEYTNREKEVARRGKAWLEWHMGYAVEMRTRVFHSLSLAGRESID